MRLSATVSLLLHTMFLALFALGARFERTSLGGFGPGDMVPVSLIRPDQLPGPPRGQTPTPPVPEPEKPEPPPAPEPEPEPDPEPEKPAPEPPAPEKPAPPDPDPGVNVSEKAPKEPAKAEPDTVAAAPKAAPKPAAPRPQATAADEALAGATEMRAGQGDGGFVAAGFEDGVDGGGGGGGGGGGFGDFGYYGLAIQNRIAANWSPAFVSGEAICIVYFRIIRSGNVVGARVEQSSGIPFYDQSALRAVLESNPMPPLPAQFPDDTVGIHFRFRYKQ
jgi:TonB family protein